MIIRKFPWLFPVSDHKFIRVYDPPSFRQVNIALNSWPRAKGPMKPVVIPHYSTLAESMSKLATLSNQIDLAQRHIYVGDITQATTIINTVENQLTSDMIHSPENIKLLLVKGMLQQSKKKDCDAVSSIEKALQLQIKLSGKGPFHHSCWFAYKCLAFAYLSVGAFDNASYIFLNHKKIVPPIYNFLLRKKLWHEGPTAYALTLIMQGNMDNGVKVLKTELNALPKTNCTSLTAELINYNLAVALEQPILELPGQALVNLGLEDLLVGPSQLKLDSH